MGMALQLLGEVLYLFVRSYSAFILLAVIAGVGFAFLSGSVEALIYDSLPADDRELEMKKAMGWNGLAFQLAFFIAPVVGGFLVPEFTVARFLFAVFLTACSVAVALLIAFSLEESPSHPQLHLQTDPTEPEPNSLTILRDGVRQLRASRLLQWLALIGIFTATFSASLVALYQPYFAQFAITSFWMGMAFAASAFLAGVSEKYAYLIERLLGQRVGFFVVTILPGLCYIGLALATRSSWLVIAFIATYGTTTLKNPLLAAYQNQLIASEQRATVLSLISLGGSLYAALTALLFGWLADIHLSMTFGVMGGLIICATLLLRVDRLGHTLAQASKDQHPS